MTITHKEVFPLENSSKQFIKSKLEEKTAKENERTKEHFDMLEKSDSIPEIFNALVSIYNNTKEQAMLQIDVVREMAVSPFFMLATAERKMNHIVFSDGDFEVIFPTSSMRKLEVKRKTQLKELYISPYKPREHETICLQLKETENRGSLRELKGIILQKEFSKKNTFFNRMRIKESTVNRFLEEYKEKTSRFEEKLKEKRERDFALKIQRTENIKFLKSIEKDTSVFIENGWILSTEELDTMVEESIFEGHSIIPSGELTLESLPNYFISLSNMEITLESELNLKINAIIETRTSDFFSIENAVKSREVEFKDERFRFRMNDDRILLTKSPQRNNLSLNEFQYKMKEKELEVSSYKEVEELLLVFERYGWEIILFHEDFFS